MKSPEVAEYHCMRLDIANFLKNQRHSPIRGFKTDSGMEASDRDARAFLNAELAQGHKYMPMCKHDNFDHETGKCRGPKPIVQDANYTVRDETAEATLKEFGRMLKDQTPEGYGFALFIYNFGEGGNLFYLSSGDRGDTIKMLKEFIQRQTQ